MNAFLNKHRDKWALDESSGCFVWYGAAQNGYGIVVTGRNGEGIRAKRKQLLSHRLSYCACFGPIASGVQIRHNCDNPRCVNPGHLSQGTHADNMKDKKDRGRAYSPTGAKNPKAKLTTKDVVSIRAKYFPNGTGKRSNAGHLAREYDVTVATIQRAAKGRTWRSAQRS